MRHSITETSYYPILIAAWGNVEVGVCYLVGESAGLVHIHLDNGKDKDK